MQKKDCDPRDAPPRHKWFYTPTAIRQWLKITGRTNDADGVNWHAAQQELCLMSNMAQVVDLRQSGAELYRCKWTVNERRRRVEMTVSFAKRSEGPLPQLVRVRVR